MSGSGEAKGEEGKDGGKGGGIEEGVIR